MQSGHVRVLKPAGIYNIGGRLIAFYDIIIIVWRDMFIDIPAAAAEKETTFAGAITYRYKYIYEHMIILYA